MIVPVRVHPYTSPRVVPPWWRSPWAYGGYALLCLAAASAAGYRWHRRRKRRNAVRAAMQEARKREEVYKAKMDFLAYMAHEVRTPFSMEMLRTWVGNLLQNRRRVRLRLQREGVADVARTDFADADRLFFDRLRGIVLEHLDEEDFCLDALAGEMGMSRSTFQRKLKGLAGMTPNELVLAIRLDKAGELLREGRYKVGEVCYMVGFKSPSHFVRSFGKRFGCSPKKYMES